ncbi:MAG: HAD family hydrolase [Promethearchaeota archaeon]
MGTIKAILFDFGFTLFTMPGVTMEKYLKIYRKGISRCLNCLIEENIMTDDENNENGENAQNLENVILTLRRNAWRKSRENNKEYTTDMIIKQALKQLFNREFSTTLINRLSDMFHSEELENWIPFDSTVAVLKTLTEKNFKLGILSNHPHHSFIKKILEKHKLTKYFQIILSSAELGMRKPSQEVFKRALNNLDCKNQPEFCVMVGDEPASDILGAYNAGMKTVLVKREIVFPIESKIRIEPDANIDNISELPGIIEIWNI